MTAPRPMARRVMRAAVMSAGIGGVVAATIAIVAADRLIQSNADRRLRAAADVLAGEIDEMRSEQDESLDEVLVDENGEIVTSGIRLAVYDGGALIAGDSWVPPAAAAACSTSGAVGERVRACARAYDRWILVAAQRSDTAGLRWQFALAGAVALLAAVILAALFGRRLTSWAVAPLAELAGRLERSEADDLVGGTAAPAADCLEVRQIEESLGELMRQVQALLERRSRFAADAAHELQTPLAALCVQLELLRDDCRDQPRADAESALRQARGLALLVDRLLTLASSAEALRRGFEPVALDDVIAEVVDGLDQVDRARIEVAVDGEGLIRGEPVLLASMIANAVDNALKFSAPHPIRLALTEPGDVARLEIRDRGPGLPLQVRERAFDAFYREHADATPGHGLGLALVGHIAEVHDATARFDDVDDGACLVIELPRIP